jgi:5-methylcytosine-specific restriction endonuclease McrA
VSFTPGFRPRPKPEPKEKKSPKPLRRTALKKKRKVTGEKALFEVIWGEREHICVNCMEYLGDEARTFFFSHIIAKKKEPRLRLIKENIRLLCLTCHTLWDHGTKDQYYARTRTIL